MLNRLYVVSNKFNNRKITSPTLLRVNEEGSQSSFIESEDEGEVSSLGNESIKNKDQENFSIHLGDSAVQKDVSTTIEKTSHSFNLGAPKLSRFVNVPLLAKQKTEVNMKVKQMVTAEDKTKKPSKIKRFHLNYAPSSGNISPSRRNKSQVSASAYLYPEFGNDQFNVLSIKSPTGQAGFNYESDGASEAEMRHQCTIMMDETEKSLFHYNLSKLINFVDRSAMCSNPNLSKIASNYVISTQKNNILEKKSTTKKISDRKVPIKQKFKTTTNLGKTRRTASMIALLEEVPKKKKITKQESIPEKLKQHCFNLTRRKSTKFKSTNNENTRKGNKNTKIERDFNKQATIRILAKPR